MKRIWRWLHGAWLGADGVIAKECRTHLPPSRGQHPRPPLPMAGGPLTFSSRPDRADIITTGHGTVYGNPGDRRCWLCGASNVPMTWTLDGYICDGPCRPQSERDADGWVGG